MFSSANDNWMVVPSGHIVTVMCDSSMTYHMPLIVMVSQMCKDPEFLVHFRKHTKSLLSAKL